MRDTHIGLYTSLRIKEHNTKAGYKIPIYSVNAHKNKYYMIFHNLLFMWIYAKPLIIQNLP